MANPKISVVIPAYNQAQYIGQAIQSVLAQTFVDWEAIIVDDGSTDNTSDCVARYADPRIRSLTHQNQERSRTRNRGIQVARGELIAFLDADDFWLPRYLEKQVNQMAAYPQAGLSYTWLYDTDAAGTIVEQRGYGVAGLHDQEALVKALLFGNRMHIGSVVVRATVFNTVGVFDPEIVHVEDWDMWLRIAIAYPVVTLAEPLACYRRYGVFMPDRLAKRNADQGVIRLVEKAFEQLKSSSLGALKAEVLGRAYWWGAWFRFAADDTRLGQELLTKADEHFPQFFAAPYSDLIVSIGYLADELYDIATPLTEALFYINKFFDNLPSWASPLGQVRRQALGQYCGLHLFRAYRRGNRGDVLKAGWLALRYQSAWLRNRGFLSILARALLSPSLPKAQIEPT